MKLFLSSIAISDQQVKEFANLVGKSAQQIKLGLIENAADPYDECSKDWAEDSRATIQSHGFNVELIDLNGFRNKPSELESKLASKDAIWCGGGNVYYLRWLLRETKADAIIKKLVKHG